MRPLSIVLSTVALLLACDSRQVVAPAPGAATSDITLDTAPVPPQLVFVPTEIGFLPGGTTSTAFAVNDSGVVVGDADVPNGATRAFEWRNGIITELPSLGGNTSGARLVSNQGLIVGFSTLPNGERHAVKWVDGVIVDLGTLGGSTSGVAAMNEAGDLVGNSTLPDGSVHAALWRNGVLRDLGTLGGTWSIATAINASGVVVGASKFDPTTDSTHAFIFAQDTMIGISGSGFAWNLTPVGITDDGRIAGNTSIVLGRAWYWDGELHDIGALPGDKFTHISDINNRGEVTGSSTDWIEGGPHGFVWRNGQFTRLGPGGIDCACRATRITDEGMIIGETWRYVAPEPYVWWRGVMTLLPTPPPQYIPQTFVTAINSTGSLVVGAYDFPSRAIVWRRVP